MFKVNVCFTDSVSEMVLIMDDNGCERVYNQMMASQNEFIVFRDIDNSKSLIKKEYIKKIFMKILK